MYDLKYFRSHVGSGAIRCKSDKYLENACHKHNNPMVNSFCAFPCLLAAVFGAWGSRVSIVSRMTPPVRPPPVAPTAGRAFLPLKGASAAEASAPLTNGAHHRSLAADHRVVREAYAAQAPHDKGVSHDARWNNLMEELRLPHGIVDVPFAGHLPGQGTLDRAAARVARAAAPAAANESQVNPEADAESKDSETVSSMIDEWESDPTVGEIMNYFRDESSKGTDSMKMRDVYKMLITMGLDAPVFVQLFAEASDDESVEYELGDEVYLDEFDGMYDDGLELGGALWQWLGKQP